MPQPNAQVNEDGGVDMDVMEYPDFWLQFSTTNTTLSTWEANDFAWAIEDFSP